MDVECRRQKRIVIFINASNSGAGLIGVFGAVLVIVRYCLGIENSWENLWGSVNVCAINVLLFLLMGWECDSRSAGLFKSE